MNTILTKRSFNLLVNGERKATYSPNVLGLKKMKTASLTKHTHTHTQNQFSKISDMSNNE